MITDEIIIVIIAEIRKIAIFITMTIGSNFLKFFLSLIIFLYLLTF